MQNVITGDDGIYRLRGCEARTTRLAVRADGRAPETKDVKVGPALESVDFVLRPAGKIRIRILDQMNNPIPNANLVFRHWRGELFGYFEFDHVNRHGDAHGVWEWNEAPIDEFKADICRPNGLCLSEQSLIARDQEYVFRIPSALVVVGKVIDAGTKEPVKQFEVTTGNRFEPRYKDLNIIGRADGVDGKYRIEQTQGHESRRTVNQIQIQSNGYRTTAWRHFTFDEAGTATIDFELTKVDAEAKPSLTGTNVAGASLPSECVTALKRNVLSLNTCAVKYSLRMEFPPMPEGSPVPLRPIGANAFTVLDQGHFYDRYERVFSEPIQRAGPNGRRRQSYEEQSYDGHIFYFGSPRLGRGRISKYLGENTDEKDVRTHTVRVPYLEATGFAVPSTIAEWRRSVLDSIVLKVVGAGKILKLAEVDSIVSLEVETPDQVVLYYRNLDLDKMRIQAENMGDAQFNENQLKLVELYRNVASRDPVRRVQFKLDREKRYALVHQEDRTLDGKLIQTADGEQFELFPQTQIWLPRLCLIRTFSNPFLDHFTEKPSVTTKIKLDEISFVRPEVVSFKIDYGPGSRVNDLSTATPPPGAN